MATPAEPGFRATSKGDTFIWGTGAAVTATLLMMLTVVGVILVNGLGTYWTSPLVQATLADGTRLLGDVTGHHVRKDGTNRVAETQFNVRNRDLYGVEGT